jgi:hypothetical protein
MATWTTPKTNWTTADGINDTDFNRIEENTEYLYDLDGNSANHLRNYISGFTVNANSGSEGVYEIRVRGGIWSDSAGNFVDWGNLEMVKTLSASNWTAGAAGQAKMNAATFSTNEWYWVYALYNPTTNAHDFCVDDNIMGDNLATATAAGYTLSRRLCAVLTSTHIAVNGIMPMHFDTNEKTIVYGGLASAKSITPPLLTGGAATSVTLTIAGGKNMIPYDSSNGITDGGSLEFDVLTSTPTILTIWQQNHFGTTYYSGVGGVKYHASGLDVHTVWLEIPTGSLYVHSSANTDLDIILRRMRYNTDEAFLP